MYGRRRQPIPRRGGIPKQTPSTVPTAADFREFHDEPMTRPTTAVETPGRGFLTEVQRRRARPQGDGRWEPQVSYTHFHHG